MKIADVNAVSIREANIQRILTGSSKITALNKLLCKNKPLYVPQFSRVAVAPVVHSDYLSNQ